MSWTQKEEIVKDTKEVPKGGQKARRERYPRSQRRWWFPKWDRNQQSQMWEKYWERQQVCQCPPQHWVDQQGLMITTWTISVELWLREWGVRHRSHLCSERKVRKRRQQVELLFQKPGREEKGQELSLLRGTRDWRIGLGWIRWRRVKCWFVWRLGVWKRNTVTEGINLKGG